MRNLRVVSFALASFIGIGCGDSGGSMASTATDSDTTSTTAPTSTTETTSSSSASTTMSTDSGTDSATTSPTSTTGDMCPNAPTNGTYSECNDQMWFCAGGGFCLQDPETTFGVCARGCIDVCNCWPKPDTGTAVPACDVDVTMDPNGTCVLDCSGGKICPDGMECIPGLDICAFNDVTVDTSTGTGPGTGSSTSG